MKKLTIDFILKNTYLSLSENSKFYVSLMAIMLAINYLLEYLILLPGWLNQFLFPMLISFIFIKVAVMVHRSILNQEFSIKNLFSWSYIEFKFFLLIIGVYFLSYGLLSIVLALVMPIFLNANNTLGLYLPLTILYVVGSLILCRLALVFPAIATDKDITLKECWEYSKGNVSTLFMLIILMPLLFNLILSFSRYDNVFYYFMISVIGSILSVFEIAVLTHCYDELFVRQQTEDEEMIQTL